MPSLSRMCDHIHIYNDQHCFLAQSVQKNLKFTKSDVALDFLLELERYSVVLFEQPSVYSEHSVTFKKTLL